MSKYNLSCTIQNIQHIAIFELLKIFFSFKDQNENKSAAKNITSSLVIGKRKIQRASKQSRMNTVTLNNTVIYL